MLKISVIIPSYNQGRFLEETILSVLDQKYPALELFVIDGGSTDNSSDIIRKYSSHLAGWVCEKDKGQSDAINKGLQMFSGDIVSWLCSDDLYTTGTLQKVNEIFSSLPESTGVIHGNSEIFKGSQVIRNDKGYSDWSVERQLAGMTFPQPSSFMRSSALKEAGNLDSSLHYGMDYDLFSRMSVICGFHYVDFGFSRYRLHNESKSTTSIAKFIEEWSLIFNSIIKGLNLTSIQSTLASLGLSAQENLSIVNYFNTKKNDLTIEEDKLLFYFLVNVIRYDYASYRFERVRKTGKYLNEKFAGYLIFEPEIRKIIRRTEIIPSPFLRFLKKLKDHS